MSLTARLAERWRSVPGGASLIAAFLLVAGLGIIFQNERAYQAQETREIRVEADILAASVTAPLDFRDADAAQEAVDALRVNPQVLVAAVYDGLGARFAGFARAGAEIPATLPTAPAGAGDAIAVSVPVLSGDERIGTVHLVSLREPLSRRLTRYVLIILLLGLASLVVAVLGVAHAALRRANRELSDANRELTVQVEERAKAEEQLRQAQKMQALGQLTGGIAHDFNNMLTVIQGSADFLQRPNLSEEKRARFAAAISQTAARAAALTAQLLAFARRQPLRPETIDLNEQILGMVELLDRTLGERVLIRTELSPDLCVVKADPAQLESAVLNVAVNARDAMPEGGTLTLRTGPAPERSEGDPPAVALSICDTGTGIDPETLARIFEPFFTTKEVGRGTGLGLSQVYGFATQSGGDVRVDSVPGEGTTVTLILPCSAQALVRPAQDARSAAATSSKASRILVVDDNEEVGAFAEALLTELGHEVIRAQSAEQALSYFARFPVDGVFSDVVMPGMSGIELAEKLREKRPELPIILTTGFSEEVTGEAVKDLPILFKPYKIEDLAEALQRAIGPRAPV